MIRRERGVIALLDLHYDESLIIEAVPDSLTDDVQENFRKAMSLFSMIDSLPEN